MSSEEIRIGERLSEALELYKQHFVLLLVCSGIALVLGGLSLGVLLGPMFAGVFIVTLRLVDRTEPTPEMSEVFKGFEHFLQAFLFTLCWGVVNLFGSMLLEAVPVFGSLLSIVFSLGVLTLSLFGLPLIADQELDFVTASRKSIEVVKQNLSGYAGLAFVAGACGSLGFIAFGIGIFLTMPFYFCVLAVTYRSVFLLPGMRDEQRITPPPPPPPRTANMR